MTARNVFAFFMTACMLSCTGKSDSEKDQTIDTTTKVALAPGGKLSHCYIYKTKKDSALLRVDILEDDMLVGKLSYAFFEKDRNDGQLTGVMQGDKIFAHYTFNSEGTKSTREVAFLKKGEGWVEGFGEVKDSAGILIFKDRSKLDFEKGLYFEPVECPMEP